MPEQTGDTSAGTPTTKPDCWCSYGTESGEYTRFPVPGCPEHDPTNTPPQALPEDDEPCEICASEREDCGYCDGGEDDYEPDGRCGSCGGSGQYVPDHCCACGGSPYCDCCKKCGQCVATCRCPVEVQMSDGTVRTLGPVDEAEKTPGPDRTEDDGD